MYYSAASLLMSSLGSFRHARLQNVSSSAPSSPSLASLVAQQITVFTLSLLKLTFGEQPTETQQGPNTAA